VKETLFIEKNKDRWQRAEILLNAKHLHAEELSQLLISITDDLAYARTFYPNRLIKVYLNNLTNSIFQKIHHKKARKFSSLLEFWTEDLPPIIWDLRRELFFSFVVFVLMFGIGVFSSIYNKEFVFEILGHEYVYQTLENIKKGDPMAIYKDSQEINMFMGISINNVRVAIMSYVSGIAMGLGSLMVLIQNGIMVGVFQYFFIHYGLGVHSASTIWLHGTIEISCIIISCGAGFALGLSFFFTGNYSRWNSFLRKGKQSFLLMIGIIPLILMAAFIEGYITRYSFLPLMVKFLLIIICLAFVIYFFIVLPYKKRNSKTKFAVQLSNSDNSVSEIPLMSNISEKLVYIFDFYKRNGLKYFWICFAFSICIVWTNSFADKSPFDIDEMEGNLYYRWLQLVLNLFQSLRFNSYHEVIFCSVILALLHLFILIQIGNSISYRKYNVPLLIRDVFLLALIYLLFISSIYFYSWFIVLFIMFLPVVFTMIFSRLHYMKKFDFSIGQHINLCMKYFFPILLNFLLVIFYVLLLFILFNSQIVYFIHSALATIIGHDTGSVTERIMELIPNIILFTSLYFSLPIVILLLFLNLQQYLEIEQSKFLLERIEEISPENA